MEQASVMWALRMALVAGGTALTSWGIGDAALWEGVTGAVLGLAGVVWSWHARRALVAAAAPADALDAVIAKHIGPGRQ